MTPHTPTYNRDKALLNLIGHLLKQQAEEEEEPCSPSQR
jgi:hypothetical protein